MPKILLLMTHSWWAYLFVTCEYFWPNQQGRLWTYALPSLGGFWRFWDIKGRKFTRVVSERTTMAPSSWLSWEHFARTFRVDCRLLRRCWFVRLWVAALKGGSKERQLFFWVKQQLVREKEAQNSGFRTCCASHSCCQCHWCWGKRRTKRRRKRTRSYLYSYIQLLLQCETGWAKCLWLSSIIWSFTIGLLRSSFRFSRPASNTKTKCK